MISGGDDIHAGVENVRGGLGRDTGTASGVLAVGDDDIDVVLAAQLRDERADGLAAGFAHDVTDEQDFHAAETKASQEVREAQPVFVRDGEGAGLCRLPPAAASRELLALEGRLTVLRLVFDTAALQLQTGSRPWDSLKRGCFGVGFALHSAW